MIRALVNPCQWSEPVVELAADESHYVLRVARARPGEAIELFDGQGRAAAGEMVGARAGRALVRLLAKPGEQPAPAVAICLLQGLAKQTSMDLIMQKAVELGASRITVLECERSVPRSASRDADRRAERWRRIAISAARQCGAVRVPIVEGPVPFDALPDLVAAHDACLMGDLTAGVMPMREAVERLLARRCARVAVLIGPEGDLSPSERDTAARAGAEPVSFGPLVLRVETAAVYALSVLACCLAR